MNYFSPKSAAERYSRGRPNFHELSIAYLKDYLQLKDKLHTALDIACGTGLSTQALLSIANEVYGTDSSQAMLDHALQKDKIHYKLAKAEDQAFESDYFDLITVCSGVHWFDIDRFLAEANRLLKKKSYLILYDNFFLGEMEGNPKFKDWYHTVYLCKFPAPARNNQYAWDNGQLFEFHFHMSEDAHFNNAVSFHKDELALYFTTQSNITWAIETKTISYEEVDAWLIHELSVFYPNENKPNILYFGNWIKFLQNIRT